MNILIHTLIVGTCTLYIPMNMIRVWNQGWLNSWGSAVLFLDFSGYPFTLKTNIRFHWEKTVSNRFIINGGIWLIKCIYSHFQSYCINLFTNRKTFLFSDQLTWSINDKEFFHWNYFVVHISATTYQIIMLTCQIFMSSCQILMLTCQIFILTCHLFIC